VSAPLRDKPSNSPSQWLSPRTAPDCLPAERSHFGRSVIGDSLVCDMPDCKRLVPRIAGRADLSHMSPSPVEAAERRQKKWPRKIGAKSGRNSRGSRSESAVSRALSSQSPKWGRSPLRAEIRALAISRRSIEAIRRPNKLLDGAKPMEAVLDIGIPFSEGGARPVMIWELSTYTRYQQQRICLHSSISAFAVHHLADLPSKRQKGRRNDRRPL
jgi:hypothetical protein